MKQVVFSLICLLCALTAHSATANAKEKASEDGKMYIDNGKVRLGVDMQRGGSVFYFALSKNKTNLLNHFDEGRFVQQSYYGEPDGSNWCGNNWSWNPIQGGGCNGLKAEVKESHFTKKCIHVVSTPVHWAYCKHMPELEMEEIITLEGNIGHIHYIFRNNGEGATSHPKTSQEMPAIFVDAAYPNLICYEGNKPWQGDSLTSTVPGWPNQYKKRTEEWSAYVNEESYGIGAYTPDTYDITYYRYGDGTHTGSEADHCSYFSPLRNFAIEKGMTVEYDVYLVIGNIQDIRNIFYRIHKKNHEKSKIQIE